MNERTGGFGLLLFVLAGIALSGCVANGSSLGGAASATPYPPPGYNHTVQSGQVALYWNCAQSDPTVLQLDAVAFNPWSSQPVRFLELELVGVDSRERTVSAAQAEARDIQLFTNQSTPFQLNLRATGNESRFDLYYRYRFQEDGHDRMDASLAWDGPILFAQQRQFLVRDACSESQHRVR